MFHKNATHKTFKCDPLPLLLHIKINYGWIHWFRLGLNLFRIDTHFLPHRSQWPFYSNRMDFAMVFFHLHFIFYNQPIHLIVCMQNNWKYPWCSPKHINHLVTHQRKYIATCSLWYHIESNFLFFIWISYIFCYYFDFKTFTHIHCTDVGLSRRI